MLDRGTRRCLVLHSQASGEQALGGSHEDTRRGHGVLGRQGVFGSHLPASDRCPELGIQLAWASIGWNPRSRMKIGTSRPKKTFRFIAHVFGQPD